MKDPIKTIGTIINRGHFERDAIHIAILPVIIDEDYLSGGTLVKFVPGSSIKVRGVTSYDEKGIGILDPYLQGVASPRPKRGDRVWCFMHPNTTVGMRHHWSNPVVDEPVITNESELWLRNFADKYGFNFLKITEMLKSLKSTDNIDSEFSNDMIANGRDLHSSEDLEAGEEELFWKHVEVITGLSFDPEQRQSVQWSCSC